MQLKTRDITEIVKSLFLKYGMCETDAEELTSILIDSHIKGYPSHGLGRVPMYIDDIKNGVINLNAEISITKEAPATALLNSNKGIGPLQMKKAIGIAIDKAKRNGIGAVALRNSNDIARLGSYVEKPAKEGLIALLYVNDGGANPAVCPTGSNIPFFSTNPIAAGIPTNKDWPIIIDISTATVALGRLKQAMNWGEIIPEGWLVERDGTSTQNPGSFFREDNPTAILPLGGLLRGHKGYVLSMLVDVLAGALSGTGTSTGDQHHPESNGVFIITINPDNFIGTEDFNAEVSSLIKRLKLLPGEVRIPGERQAQNCFPQPLEIDLDPITWKKIQELQSEVSG